MTRLATSLLAPCRRTRRDERAAGRSNLSENVPNPESNPRHYLRLYFPMATAALFRAHILRHSLRFARGSATTTSGAHILRLCLRRVAVFFVRH